ncbi:MAG: polysaccharide biosynthesis protein [Acidobacteriota bacterium]|jgi:FlaA1/EpsC-like NDP-sugar epimerase
MHSEAEILSLLGRREPMFRRDLARHETELTDRVRGSSILVLGGAGAIGRQVVKSIFAYAPARLDVVDASENNLVELVRDVRSSHGYIDGEFRTLALVCGEPEFDAFWQSAPRYQHVLNLTALKHVRSERDPFTLMRMLHTNVLVTEATLQQAIDRGAEGYFSVSSDKAARPANAMGASKRVMELCLLRASERIAVSSSRFANVAFSDGSLLAGFENRLAKRQPLAAPENLQRYFITGQEAGRLCLMAAFLGENRDAFIPSRRNDFEPIDFRSIAERFLNLHGYEARSCDSEEEARDSVGAMAAEGLWPCFFSAGDTTGEKPLEEFSIAGESVVTDRFDEIDVIRWPPLADHAPLDHLLATISKLRHSGCWRREDLIHALEEMLPEFDHRETGKFLDDRM